MLQYSLAPMVQTLAVQGLARDAANDHFSGAAASTPYNPVFLLLKSAQRPKPGASNVSTVMAEGPAVPKTMSLDTLDGGASLTMSENKPLPPCPSFVSGAAPITATPVPQSEVPVPTSKRSATNLLHNPSASITRPETSSYTTNLIKSNQETRGWPCHESFVRSLQDPAASQKSNSIPTVSLPNSAQLSTTLQSNNGAVARNFLSMDIPDFLSGFDNFSPPLPSQAASETAIAVTSDTVTPYSPTYTSRSFDDLHRFLGEGLSPHINESTKQVATGEANESGERMLEGPAPFPSLTSKNVVTCSGTEDPHAASTSAIANQTRYKLQIRPTAKRARSSAQRVNTTSSMEEALGRAYTEALLVEAQKISPATSNEGARNAHKHPCRRVLGKTRHTLSKHDELGTQAAFPYISQHQQSL